MTNSIRDFPVTFPELTRALNGKQARTICNNTVVRVIHPDDTYQITLYGNHIATVWKDGTVYVRDAGYQTVTTKQRLNKILYPLDVYIYQEDYSWYVADRSQGNRSWQWFGDLIVPFPWTDTPYGTASIEKRKAS